MKMKETCYIQVSSCLFALSWLPQTLGPSDRRIRMAAGIMHPLNSLGTQPQPQRGHFMCSMELHRTLYIPRALDSINEMVPFALYIDVPYAM
jgi:hypothetical protein